MEEEKVGDEEERSANQNSRCTYNVILCRVCATTMKYFVCIVALATLHANRV